MTHPDTPRPPMSETVKPLSQEELDEQRALEPNGSSAVFRGRWLATIADLEAKLEKAERDLAQSREWRPIESAPRNGTPIVAARLVRYQPYKPDGARQMRAPGRWQEWTGYGWRNTGDEPESWQPTKVPPTTGSAP